MHLKEKAAHYIETLKSPVLNDGLLERLVRVVDYTSLNETDTAASVAEFCNGVTTDYGSVAAVCVWPQFVEIANAQLAGKPIKLAAVANFPSGNADLTSTLEEINQALTSGANEIDIVMPQNAFQQGDFGLVEDYLSACKAALGDDALMKVILETGVLQTPDAIINASQIALKAGADFLKTSTGKVAIGATLEAAALMLLTIQNASFTTKSQAGLKVSGGIKTWEEAARYLALVETILGKEFTSAKHFRIGASKLLQVLP